MGPDCRVSGTTETSPAVVVMLIGLAPNPTICVFFPFLTTVPSVEKKNRLGVGAVDFQNIERGTEHKHSLLDFQCSYPVETSFSQLL